MSSVKGIGHLLANNNNGGVGGLECQGLLEAFFLQVDLLGDVASGEGGCLGPGRGCLSGLDLIPALLSPVGPYSGHASSLQLQ